MPESFTCMESAYAMSLVSVACPLCKSTDSDILVTARSHHRELEGEYSIVVCRNCKCSYLNPTLSRDSLSRAYSILQSNSATTDAPSRTTKSPGVAIRWWRRHCSYQVERHVVKGPVLDLGCNDGELMQALNLKGLQTFGVEFSPEAVEMCRRKGLHVEQADLENLDPPLGRFRTIVLSHVLEHLADPISVLKRVSRGLADGGVIVICVPNIDSPIRRIFGANWHGWDPPFHLVHYNERSLTNACDKAGLKVTRVIKRMIPDDLGRSLSLTRRKSGAHLLIRLVSTPALGALSMMRLGSYLLVTARRK
jgi:2-polyprenyl-3-methyl-5-hydroxy-6-metoxy-1,4-benzoquinol methylase